jgi:hypothetical protein
LSPGGSASAHCRWTDCESASVLVDGEASRSKGEGTFAGRWDCVLREGGLVPMRDLKERCVLLFFGVD